ncbi:hypothetical protein BEL05_20405 [Shewanella colwelliana]|uniref:Uncharacterized protein n=1 Tax=Shewanella colwelliana TaxID=23 RepID=A0A1E5ITY9_SHECO|nr:hypothetical protein [Shewanella colwelliana]OEG74041.1 hypothetical protein BEL05_20405 [Shewanella colwelliana]
MSTPPNLTEEQKNQLRVLEPKLRLASVRRDFEECKNVTAQIQGLLRPTGHETRLMQSKNWLYETAMEVGKIDYAIRGFIGVRQKASTSTRLYLEATSLLAICHLRKSDLEKARPFMVEALKCEKNIKSESRRSDFKISLAKRFDEEALLSSIATNVCEDLNVDKIQEDAAKLIQTKHEDEILELLGSNVPEGALDFIERVNAESKNLLTYEEKLMLPSPATFKQKKKLGKGVLAAFQTVIWQSLCDKNSDVYKIWFTNGLQAVLDKKYLTTAIVGALSGLKIGIYAIAVYLTSLLIKMGIETFCNVYQPNNLMALRK